MKWYWVVDCDNTVDNPLVVDTEDLKGFDEWTFTRGERIENWDPQAWLKASKLENDGDPDDILQNHLDLPIYSARLRKALEEATITGIQYLPIKVLRPDGSLIEGFSIANILNLALALDLKKSDYDVFPDDYFLPERRGEIQGVRKAVLRRTALEGRDIIRLKEYEVSIYVSERFKAVFESGRFTGYSFHEVNLS